MALLGIVFLLVGIRFYDSGIFRITGGDLQVFCAAECGRTHAPEIFLPDGSTVYRINLEPDFDVCRFLKESGARIVLEEGRIIYAFSPLIRNFVILSGRRVNMMINRDERAVNIGIPILLGSF